MIPTRIQLKRTKGWRMPANTAKVDRTTRWGNPFVIGKPGHMGRWIVEGPGVGIWPRICGNEEGARLVAVDLFRRMVERDPTAGESLAVLRGKNLACWCKPGAACHADVLLELANK